MMQCAATNETAARLGVDCLLAGANAFNLLLPLRSYVGWLEIALTSARRMQRQGAIYALLSNLGVTQKHAGDFGHAVTYHLEALSIGYNIGDTRAVANALGNLANTYFEMGEKRRAIGCYKRCLALFRNMGNQRRIWQVLDNLGASYFHVDEPRRAVEYHQQALTLARESGDRMTEANALTNLGNAYGALPVRSSFSGFRKFQCVEFRSLMRYHRFMGKLTADLPPRY
jgi:tetratricopeptide (TPR) repeat protein